MKKSPGRWWVGGLVGPSAFVAAWVGAGAATEGYSPVEDAISRLAAQGASTRAVMTGGFVAFGIGVPLYAVTLRRTLPGGAWLAASASGLATLGVALFPLDQSPAGDRMHAVFAGAGYAALAVTPVLAARPLWRRGQRGAAVASVLIGAASGFCLGATAVGPAHGLFQRVGLTLVDAWLAATAVAIARGHLGPGPRDMAATTP
jgi:hypothetical membrane protein